MGDADMPCRAKSLPDEALAIEERRLMFEVRRAGCMMNVLRSESGCLMRGR